MNDTVNILIVDDDAEYVSVAKHYLRSFQNKKFDVTWVDNGEAAIQLLSSDHRFDIVLMDFYLPEKNGLEIIHQISEKKIQIPIILLTANKDFRIAIEAMKYGVEEYLVKDAAIDSVLPRTIMNVLEQLQLKKQIDEAEKEKLMAQKKTEAIQELVVTMCHEFNNPLAAIKISTNILSRQKIIDDEKVLLEELNKNISLLERLIIKLRDLNA